MERMEIEEEIKDDIKVEAVNEEEDFEDEELKPDIDIDMRLLDPLSSPSLKVPYDDDDDDVDEEIKVPNNLIVSKKSLPIKRRTTKINLKMLKLKNKKPTLSLRQKEALRRLAMLHRRQRMVRNGENPPSLEEMMINYEYYQNLQRPCKQFLSERSSNNELHCLVCYEKLETPATEEEQNDKKSKELQENLNAIFILRKMLDVPSTQLEKYLKVCKGPSSWVSVCERCQPLVTNALDLNDKIVELMKQLEKCKEMVINKIKETAGGDEAQDGNEKECPNAKKCKGHHSYLTDEIRKCVLEKTYISSSTVMKEGDNQSKLKYEECLEAERLRKRRLARKSNVDIAERTLAVDINNFYSYQQPPEEPLIYESDPDCVNDASSYSPKKKVGTIDRKGTSYICPYCPDLHPFENVFSYVGHIIFHFDYPMQCSQCHLYFPQDKEKLDKHWKEFHRIETQIQFHHVKFSSVDDDASHYCYQCWKTFANLSERDAHMQKLHKCLPKKDRACITCDERFMSLIELILHRAKVHPVIAKYSCPVCDEQFKTEDGMNVDEESLKDHILSAHSSLEIPLVVKPCLLCGHIFTNNNLLSCLAEMDSHIVKTHSTFVKIRFKCEKCNRVFLTANARQLHSCALEVARSRVSNPDSTTYSCPACSTLPERMNIDQFLCHIAFHYERPFQCFACKQYFSDDKAKQDQHWKEWHKELPPPLQPSFVKVKVSEIKFWECHKFKCEARFATDSERNPHLREKHHVTIPATVRCPFCPALSFKNENEMKIHQATVHPTTMFLKRFKCPVCNISFKNSTSDGKEFLDTPALQKHMDIHHKSVLSSYKQVACKFCGLVFTGTIGHFPNFITHKRNSHGYGFALSCHICEEDFFTLPLLNTHLSTAHPKVALCCDFCPFEEKDCDYERLHKHKCMRHGIRGVQVAGVQIRQQQTLQVIPPICLESQPKKVSPAIKFKTAKKDEPGTVPHFTLSTSFKNAEGSEVQISLPLPGIKPQIAEVDDPTRYSCPNCPHLAPMRPSAFFQHIAFHQERPKKCSECLTYLPPDEEAINTHWNQSHSNSKKVPRTLQVPLKTGNVWRCEKSCEKVFASDDERELHEVKLHKKVLVEDPSRKEYFCDSCPKKFHSLLNWQFHRVVSHPSDAELSCFYCNEKFTFRTETGVGILHKKERTAHLKKEHPELPIMPDFYMCRFCGQCFTGEAALTSHLQGEHKVDENELFLCSFCPLGFKEEWILYDHMRQLHFSYGLRSRICEVCGWSASARQGEILFHIHKFNKHGILPPDKFPILKCDFEGCSFQTLRQADFKCHRAKHLPMSERPYQCQSCEKGFSQLRKLEVHEAIHKNALTKPYQCEICGNSFAVRNYLYIHMRLSHQRRFFPSTHKKKPSRKKGGSVKSSNDDESKTESNSNPKDDNHQEHQDQQVTVQNSNTNMIISEAVSTSVLL